MVTESLSQVLDRPAGVAMPLTTLLAWLIKTQFDLSGASGLCTVKQHNQCNNITLNSNKKTTTYKTDLLLFVFKFNSLMNKVAEN